MVRSVPLPQNFQDKVVVPAGLRRRIASLRLLAEDLLISRAESSSSNNAPALSAIYPLQYMESWMLITAFHRWMEIAGNDGVFIEGLHGDSDVLCEQEPDIASGYSALMAIDMAEIPTRWPLLYQSVGLRELRDAEGIGNGASGSLGLSLGQTTNQSLLDQLARGGPSVCRISGVVGTEIVVFDRLWLPIATADRRISRCITVFEPISCIRGPSSR